MSKAQFTKPSDSNVSSDEWYTPIEIVNRVQAFYDGYDFHWIDVASNDLAQKHIKASQYFDIKMNALNPCTSWQANAIWMNPPYSRKLISQFVGRFIEEYTHKRNFDHAIILVNSCTDTQWFYSLAIKADIRIDIQGRLHFWHPDKPSKSPISGSTLFYYGELWEQFLVIFGDLGLCYESVATK